MSRRRGSSRWDQRSRERALELADEHGLAAASRELGIPYGTIKWWRHRDGLAGPPKGADPESWAEKKREGAEESWAAARSALDRVKELIGEGEERKAKDAALTMAIMLDKSAALEQASALADERDSKFAEAQAEGIAEALIAAFDDFGLPRSDAVGEVIAHHLRPLSEPDAPRGPTPNVDQARADLRSKLREEWDRELRRIEPIAALPAGPSSGGDGETSTAARRVGQKDVVEAEAVEEWPTPGEEQHDEKDRAASPPARQDDADEKRRRLWNKRAGPARVSF